MKRVIGLLIFVLLLATGVTAAQQETLYMPLVFKNGVLYDTPTPTVTATPTKTATPKPPTPTPTATPTLVQAEGGNSCVYVDFAWRNSDGSTTIAGLVPSVCSYMTQYDVQAGGTLLIVKANRIKTDTYGCEESDFGPLVEWPPVDSDCPPPPEDELRDEWGRILWGDFETLTHPNSYQVVCGYCEECGYPYTVNCVDVYNPPK